MYPYSGRLPSPPPVLRVRPNAVRAADVPRGFPLVGNGLGGFPVRKTEVPDAWELGVEITAGGQDYTVDIEAGTGINLYIDWGDGLVELFQSTGDKTHTYSAPGWYTVRITGGFAASGNIRLGSNVGNRARLKKTSIIPFIPGLPNFHATFYGCTGLTSIPADLFRYNTKVSTNGFQLTFYVCTGLTAIPDDLFKYNTAVSTSGFYATFYGCSGLTGSIPTDLFRYNTLVSTDGFRGTFWGCTGLTGSIPTDLFRYNTAVSTSGFYATFSGCTGLTGSIPTDLFRYNTLVSTIGFRETFNGCTGLTTAPALLFKYNVNCTSFNAVFQNCNQLQLRADLFFDTGEEGTRFLNQTVDFTSAMRIGTFTGTQGTAPALWSCDFGTGSATTTTCFTGHTTSSVDNYASIPTAWGGA